MLVIDLILCSASRGVYIIKLSTFDIVAPRKRTAVGRLDSFIFVWDGDSLAWFLNLDKSRFELGDCYNFIRSFYYGCYFSCVFCIYWWILSMGEICIIGALVSFFVSLKFEIKLCRSIFIKLEFKAIFD